ncbi:MAG: hypothetical protein ACO3CQ_00140 [Candidatus Nanopelagicaceae bacterium]
MLNPFFLNGTKAEQGLVQDLINEQLRMYGVEIYYIPRIFKKENTIIKEVVESEFGNAYPLEAYVNDYEGYGGQGTILSKFGLQDMDDLSLTISRERFETYIVPLIKQLPDIKLPDRPKEGDLIWFPLGDRLFEIKFVEHEQPFYPLKGNYTYELKCELYRYEQGEVVDTSIDEIDDNLIDAGYIQTLQMIGIAVTATAYTSIVNDGIQYIEVTNMGRGYTSNPIVAISSAFPGTGYPTLLPAGKTGIATAVLEKNIPDFCEMDTNKSKVVRIDLINPGYGYTQTPSVSILGGGGENAAGKAYLKDGIIGIITLSNPGSGYSIRPSVTFVGGGTTVSAAATVRLTPSGSIESIYITNAGAEYTSIPEIVIGPPSSGGSGTYEFNEVVVGTISSTTARVKRWNINNYLLEVGNLNGKFVDGDVLVGQESGARYAVRIINTDNLADPGDQFKENKEDVFADNKNIQREADLIIDFSEQNPFGTP